MSIEKIIHPLTTSTRYRKWESGWGDKSGLDYFSYISDVCNPEDALIFCGLLFPAFIERAGGVFLDGRFDQENFAQWSERLNGNVYEVERLINHVHVYDVFSGCSEDVADSVFEKLSEVIGFCWEVALKNKFPHKKFKVEVSNSDQDYGPVVTFFQVSGSQV